MSELAGGSLGPEAKWDLSLSDGKLLLKGKYAGLGGGVDLTASISADYFLDELAKMIPGQLDDAVLKLLKAALAAV